MGTAVANPFGKRRLWNLLGAPVANYDDCLSAHTQEKLCYQPLRCRWVAITVSYLEHIRRSVILIFNPFNMSTIKLHFVKTSLIVLPTFEISKS